MRSASPSISAEPSELRGLPVAIYARASSDPHYTGRSTSGQVSECRAWCDERGWPVDDTYVDTNRSASRYARRSRPEFDRLIQDIEAGRFGALVMWEGSRGTRDLGDFVELRDLCERHGVLYVYSGRVHDLSREDDCFSTTLDAALSEREARVIRQRILRGVKKKADAGRPHGKILFGYAREYDPKTKEFIRQYIVEEQAAVIREAAERASRGESCYGIARDLNARNAPTPGGKWRPEQVKRVVINPAYAAKVVHQGKIIDAEAQWPAILDEALWAACVTRLTDPRRKTVQDMRIKHLMSGVARCGVCGSKMRPRKNRSCYSYMCIERFHVAIKVEWLEGYVTDLVIERLSRPDVAELYQQPDIHGDAARAQAEAADLRERLDGFYATAAEGRLSGAGLARMEEQLLPRIEAAERRAINAVTPPLLREVSGADARQRWAALGIAQRREVVDLLCDVKVMPVGVGHRSFNPDRIVVTWKE